MQLIQFLLNEGISGARETYLKRFKKKLPSALEKKLLDLDPSKNKKYVEWIVRTAKSFNNEEDLNQYSKTLKSFNILLERNQIPPDKRDIYKYKDLESLYDLVIFYKKDEEEDVPQTKTSLKKKYKSEGSEKIWENDKVAIYKVTSHDASRTIGVGAKWCVAQKEDPYYWNSHYHNQLINFYFIIKKGVEKRSDSKQKIAVAVHSNGKKEGWDKLNRRMPDEEFEHYCKKNGIPL